MTDLSQRIVPLIEKYAGSDRAIGWTLYQSDSNPVYWFTIRNHPNPQCNLTMHFFVNYDWVEVQIENNSLYDPTPSDEVRIIDLDPESAWLGVIVEIIESWLEYIDGRPSRSPLEHS